MPTIRFASYLQNAGKVKKSLVKKEFCDLLHGNPVLIIDVNIDKNLEYNTCTLSLIFEETYSDERVTIFNLRKNIFFMITKNFIEINENFNEIS